MMIKPTAKCAVRTNWWRVSIYSSEQQEDDHACRHSPLLRGRKSPEYAPRLRQKCLWLQSVQAVRGMESRSIAKAQSEGG